MLTVTILAADPLFFWEMGVAYADLAGCFVAECRELFDEETILFRDVGSRETLGIVHGQDRRHVHAPGAEGGGDEDVIILFSIRSNGGVCYEILDDGLNIVSTLAFDDFKQIYAAGRA